MLDSMKGIMHNDKEHFLFPLSPKLRRKYILFYVILFIVCIYSIVLPSNQKNKLFPFDFFDNQPTPSTTTSSKKENVILLPQISSKNSTKKQFDQKEIKIIDFQKEYEEDLEFLEMFDEKGKINFIYKTIFSSFKSSNKKGNNKFN
jgi:hypothetical protein